MAAPIEWFDDLFRWDAIQKWRGADHRVGFQAVCSRVRTRSRLHLDEDAAAKTLFKGLAASQDGTLPQLR
jgi:hypothetical protein